jgi:ABC-type transport system substrate-binding protein
MREKKWPAATLIKIVASALVAMLLALALVACSNGSAGSEQAGSGTGESGAATAANVLVLGAHTDFKKGAAAEGQSLVFDTLTRFSDDMQVEPNIISSWDTNADVTEYTLHIVPGVTFSDGTPLTAEIVEYSLTTWAPYREASFIYYLDSIEVIDDETLAVRLTESYGNLPVEMTKIYVSLPGSLDDTGNVTNWVGTGPFVLDGYTAAQSAELSVRADYWNVEQKPSIDGVSWKVIPDASARVIALESGEVDAIGVSEHYVTIPYSQIASLMEDKQYVVDVADSGLVISYVYNWKAGLMADFALRQAVTYAIDRQAVSDNVLFGIGQPCGDFMVRGLALSPTDEQEYRYDADVARTSLADAGYVDSDNDGIVEKDGKPVTLRLLTTSDETSRSTAVIVQDCLKAVGLGCELTALDQAAMGEQAAAGEFDICYTHPWIKTPQTYLAWRGASDQYDMFGIGFGVNDKFQGYLHDALVATDEAQLQELFRQVWADEYAFYPGTGLHVQPRAFIHSPEVTGFAFGPSEEIIDLSKVEITR